MKRKAHIGDTVPMVCRFCGSKLVVGKREFDHFGDQDILGTTEVVYLVVLVCPKRLVKFSFTYFLHDLREFNEDFTIEYKI